MALVMHESAKQWKDTEQNSEQWPLVDVVSEFIKFDTISNGLKIGFKKYKIKLLIILKKEVYFLIPAWYYQIRNEQAFDKEKRCSDER